MNRGRNLLKKAATAALAASMVLTGGTNVFAAGSYQDTAKASLDSLVSSVSGAAEEYAQNMAKGLQGSTGKITLTVEDTGKAILGSFLGQEDMTWFQDLTMDMDVSIKDGTEAIDSTILMNGEKICDLNIYQDMSDLTQYIQIPEVSEAYLAIKPADDGDDLAQELTQNYVNILTDIQSEMTALTSEINRIQSTTQFNTQNLLDGKFTKKNLQVGALSGQKITISIKQMNATNLKISNISVTSYASASAAMSAIQKGISVVSTQRSNLGAIQNRLEHTIANLDNISENTSSAESRIRDTDMAEEMVEYSKNNILAQAGQSMLAQANQYTQGVLSLLQ